jgi:hypothetical protein
MAMGRVTPTLCIDVNPGETFEFGNECFVRAMPMIAPIMDRVEVTHRYFFVPNRILWVDWERWISGQLVNKPPYVEFGGTDPNTPKPSSLADYLGVPVPDDPVAGVYDLAEFSAFPFAGYNKIMNEYYHHQWLNTPLQDTCIADDNTSYFQAGGLASPLRSNWKKDRFTSAMPFPAAPTSEVNIPITHAQGNEPVKLSADGTQAPQTNLQISVGGNLQSQDPQYAVYTDPVHNANVNDFRHANAVQKWLERMGIVGRRYRELLWGFFGANNGDARLDVPEYIGYRTNVIRISEVSSTAETIETNGDVSMPVGWPSGHGVALSNTGKWKYTFPEFGWLFCLTTIAPPPSYMNQGRHKRWFKQNYEDYLWPQFAEIGEQEITEGELYMQGANRTNVFGYEPRYSEYKSENNRVSGMMGSSLAFYHLGRKFTATPTLSESFIQCDPRTDIFTVITEDTTDPLLVNMYHTIKAKRQLPIFSQPALRG